MAQVQTSEQKPGSSGEIVEEKQSHMSNNPTDEYELDRLFEVAYRFYKRNESKAFHPSFDVRNQLNALILQAKYGNLDSQKAPDIGFLDLVGKNRRNQWSLLKGKSKSEAMSEFISILDEICPVFKAYIAAYKAVNSNAEDRTNVSPDTNEPSKYSSQQNINEQLEAIRTSLCRQTYKQFKNYAEKQFPNEATKQENLINSLQEQYCRQYISRMHPDLSPNDQRDSSSPQSLELAGTTGTDNAQNLSQIEGGGNPNTSPTLNELYLRCDEQSSISSKLSQNDSPYVAVNMYPNNEATRHGQYANSADHQSSDRKPTTDNNNEHLPPISYESGVDLQSVGRWTSYPEPTPLQRPPIREDSASSRETHSNHQTTNPCSTLSEPQPNPIRHPPEHLPPPPPLELPELEFQTHVQQPEPTSEAQSEMSSNTSVNNNSSNNNNNEINNTEQHQHVKPSWSSSESDSPLQQSIAPVEWPLEKAIIWTKKGVNELRDSLIGDKHGGAYVVKGGTLLNIQVPTDLSGKYIYFEFATEDYDIGFGMDFLYDTSSSTEPLAMKIYEETDEDDDEIEELDLANNDSCESSEAAKEELLRKRAERFSRIANTISIVPTYRRDSHMEVILCKHRYPSPRGWYIIKLDNTYSIMRSKSIFFRVCHFI